ncbi:MAG: T9SS type A sorting domain-containing protein [Sphingobacteriaceae bacterium]|nr:T9SS type A sorting domain-containing protein [Sphingobacteriaceae bacterium]
MPENCIPKIEILSTDEQNLSDFLIAPSKGSLKRNIDPTQIPYVFGKIYTENKFYPNTPIEFNKAYNLRGQNGISLSVFPVKVNSYTGEAVIYSKLVFKISYLNAKGKKIALHTKSANSIDEKEIFSSRFINWNTNSAEKMAYTQLSEYGEMLIIAHPTFSNEMQPFVDWKNQKGIKTNMVTTALTGTTGPAVKTYIQNYYNANPNLLYVLLVGDHQQINAYNAGPAGSETKWSDTYYALLNGNDHYPELMMGRFSASTNSDVATMVERTLEYEKNPTGGEWLTQALGIGSNEGYGIGDENEADWVHLRKIGNKLVTDGYSFFHEFYDSTHAGNDAPGNPSASAVSSTVNSGVSLFMYCGHGSQNGCATSNYNISNVNTSTNNGKYPFSLQVACNNGTFHNGTCFCEAFMRARNQNGPTGAINTCGSTILMAWAEPMDTQDEIGDILSNQYNLNKKYTTGGLFYNGQMHMLDMYPTAQGEEVMETWLMFGDPSCMIRNRSFSNIAATHDNCITPGSNSVNVFTNLGEGKYISISQNNILLGGAQATGGNQAITLTQTFTPSNNLQVTITEFNKVPFISVLPVCQLSGISKSKNIESEIYAETLFSNEITIHIKKNIAEPVNVEIYDLQGKIIIEKSLPNNSTEIKYKLNANQLQTGVYLLKLKKINGELFYSQKLIKSEY